MSDQHPWLSKYPNHVKWDAEIPEKPLFALLDDSVARYPTNESMDFLGKTYTYSEVGDMVTHAAAGFQELGVGKGVKVGLFLPNCPQFVVAYFGILKAGGTVVNYSPLYSEEELLHQIEDSETDIMVTLSLKALYPKMAKMLQKSRVKRLVVGALQDVLPFPKNLLFPVVKRSEIAKLPNDSSHVAFRQLLNNEGRHTTPEIDVKEDIAVLQYTGGTTGLSKGAMLTHANLYANTQQALMWNPDIGYGNERMMGVLPFFHVFAMTVVMNLTIAIGGSIVMRPRFELDPVLKDITNKKPTLLPGVPTMYTAINNHPKLNDFDLTSIKTCMSGGAPLPLEIKQRFEQLSGCKLVEGYGLTECAPVATTNPFDGVEQGGIGRSADPRHHDHHRRQGRSAQSPASGRRRRNLHLRPAGDEGLLGPPGSDRGNHRRRSPPHRRCRPYGRGRLRLHYRPQEGFDPGPAASTCSRAKSRRGSIVTRRSRKSRSSACPTSTPAKRSRPSSNSRMGRRSTPTSLGISSRKSSASTNSPSMSSSARNYPRR